MRRTDRLWRSSRARARACRPGLPASSPPSAGPLAAPPPAAPRGTRLRRIARAAQGPPARPERPGARQLWYIATQALGTSVAASSRVASRWIPCAATARGPPSRATGCTLPRAPRATSDAARCATRFLMRHLERHRGPRKLAASPRGGRERRGRGPSLCAPRASEDSADGLCRAAHPQPRCATRASRTGWHREERKTPQIFSNPMRRRIARGRRREEHPREEGAPGHLGALCSPPSSPFRGACPLGPRRAPGWVGYGGTYGDGDWGWSAACPRSCERRMADAVLSASARSSHPLLAALTTGVCEGNVWRSVRCGAASPPPLTPPLRVLSGLTKAPVCGDVGSAGLTRLTPPPLPPCPAPPPSPSFLAQARRLAGASCSPPRGPRREAHDVASRRFLRARPASFSP